ncbi:MAG TPA: D-alanyl-D-alanine carboxypeptidase [Candidatus Fimivivens faecavium]|nr:D-alanyl-D-alanine carboxypeptidase [Candidatus Fimivivens faecavium]
MKKFAAVLFSLLFCLSALSPAAEAAAYSPSFEVDAESVYLYNLDSDMMIYEKNADKRMQPAELAQIMTVILTLENVPDLDSATVTMKGYIQDEMYRQNISLGGIRLAGLLKDETLSVRKLLYAVMLPSANEAATMLADYVGDGSVPYFVELMNQKAAEIGAVNTHFTSPHGLPDPASYTTAYDMYLITRYAMELEGFSALIEPQSYDGGPTNLHDSLIWSSSNKLIRTQSVYYNQSAFGVKSGYNAAEGACIAAAAKKDGYTYLLVIFGARGLDGTGQDLGSDAVFPVANSLFDWAFDTFRVKTLVEKGKSFGEVPLKLAWGKDFVRLMGAESFTALIPDEIEPSSITFDLVLPGSVKAPVEQGQLIGEVKLVLAGEVIGRVGLVSAETVEVSRMLLLVDKLVGMTRSYWFKFIVVFLTVLIILYIILMIARNRNRRRYRRRR